MTLLVDEEITTPRNGVIPQSVVDMSAPGAAPGAEGLREDALRRASKPLGTPGEDTKAGKGPGPSPTPPSLNWPSSISKETRREIENARGFAALNSEQRQQFLGVVDSAIRYENPPDRKPIQDRCVELLTLELEGKPLVLATDDGAPAGTLLSHLHAIATASRDKLQPATRTCRDRILSGMIGDITDSRSEAIQNASSPTCGQVAMLRWMAGNTPAVFAALVEEKMTGPQKVEESWFDAAHLQDTTPAMSLLQHSIGLGQGLDYGPLEETLERYRKRPHYRVDGADKVLNSVDEASRKGKFNEVAMYWKAGTMHEYHALEVVRVLRQSDLAGAVSVGGHRVIEVPDGPKKLPIPVTPQLENDLRHGPVVVMWNPQGEHYPVPNSFGTVIDSKRSIFYMTEANFKQRARYAMLEGGTRGVTPGIPAYAAIDPDRGSEGRADPGTYFVTPPRMELLRAALNGSDIEKQRASAFGFVPDGPPVGFEPKERGPHMRAAQLGGTADMLSPLEDRIAARFTAWNGPYDSGPSGEFLRRQVTDVWRSAVTEPAANFAALCKSVERNTPAAISEVADRITRAANTTGLDPESRKDTIRELLERNRDAIRRVDVHLAQRGVDLTTMVRGVFGDEMPKVFSDYVANKEREKADETVDLAYQANFFHTVIGYSWWSRPGGLKPDSNNIIDTLASLSPTNRARVAEQYSNTYNVKFEEVLAKKLSGEDLAFAKALMQGDELALGPAARFGVSRLLQGEEYGKKWLFKALEQRAAAHLAGQDSLVNIDSDIALMPNGPRSVKAAIDLLKGRKLVSGEEAQALDDLYQLNLSPDKQEFLRVRNRTPARGVDDYNHRDMIGDPFDMYAARLHANCTAKELEFLGDLSKAQIDRVFAAYLRLNPKAKGGINSVVPYMGQTLEPGDPRYLQRELALGFVHNNKDQVLAARTWQKLRDVETEIAVIKANVNTPRYYSGSAGPGSAYHGENPYNRENADANMAIAQRRLQQLSIEIAQLPPETYAFINRRVAIYSGRQIDLDELIGMRLASARLDSSASPRG